MQLVDIEDGDFQRLLSQIAHPINTTDRNPMGTMVEALNCWDFNMAEPNARSVTRKHGKDAAVDFYLFVRSLPEKSGAASDEEFVIGCTPAEGTLVPTAAREALQDWYAMVAEAYQLVILTTRGDFLNDERVGEFGERMGALLMRVAGFVVPRQRARDAIAAAKGTACSPC